MDAQRNGVLADFQIRELIEVKAIGSNAPLAEDQIQPASLDLRLGRYAFRVRSSFLAGTSRTVSERIGEYAMHRIDLSSGAVMEKGCVYLVQLQEGLNLEQSTCAAANAKSSTGRLDILTRLIADGGTEFDRIEHGYCGPLYAEVCPRSFSIKVRTGSRLNQIRFRIGNTMLSDSELRCVHDQHKLVSGNASIDGGLGFSVDLQRPDNLVGYKARPHAGIIDIDKVGSYRIAEFWEPVLADSGRIILDPGTFYILVSRQSVCIPPGYAAEMMPYTAMAGEFRVHYAGFFDPGFGFVGTGGEGSRGVLEVRCHEVPFLLEHRQTVGRLIFERMSAQPAKPYGSEGGSNYQGQDLKLSKHFIPT